MKRTVSIAGFLFVVVSAGMVNHPAVAATTQPAVALSAMEQVNDALKLSPKDELLLSSLRDTTDPTEQNGFYRMMQIASALPALNAEELRQLDSPAWANLVREPARYRRLPVRLNLRVYVVRELKVNKGLQANPYWPEGKSIYEMHATYIDSQNEPVLLYAAAAPAGLGTPTETLGDGSRRYNAGPAYQVAGVYLEYYTGTSTDGDIRNYPVILAWQIEPAASLANSIFEPFAGNESMFLWGAVLLLLIAAAGMFVFVQRRLRRPSAAQRGPVFKNYKPLRDEEPADPAVEQYVDSDLAAAVDSFHKDKNPPKDTTTENEDAQ